MVFCNQNCSDLLWEKIVLVIEKNFWNSRLKAKILRSLEQFIQTVKGQNNFLVTEIFLIFHCFNKLFKWSQTFFSITRTFFSHSRSEQFWLQNTISFASVFSAMHIRNGKLMTFEVIIDCQIRSSSTMFCWVVPLNFG